MDQQIMQEALSAYDKAYKLGRKSTKKMPVLDEILKEKKITGTREIDLGLVQIPLDQMVGTKTSGRAAAFNGDFYPALEPKTEFAGKWCSLYGAHIAEGIRDPVKAYEFMNKFYVEEGNKRVSVLKNVGAVSVPGYVTRIIPPRSRDRETRIYYEFMDFYELSGINYIWFSKPKSFSMLQLLVGKRPDQVWTDEDKLEFGSAYNRFEAEYLEKGGKKLDITVGDAFLYFISLFDYHNIKDMTTAEYKAQIVKMRDDFALLVTDSAVQIQTQPEADQKQKKSLVGKVEKLLPSGKSFLKAAFLYPKTPEDSGWSYIHELGRQYVQEKLQGQVETSYYSGVREDNADAVLQCAIEDGNQVIFATSPTMLKACLKAAVDHPEIIIMDCSLNRGSRYVRTYYARMYEAKFLMGAIAGAMSETGRIGYVADYPIYGMTANINAFALGAKMVNPRAKIYLEWRTLKDHDVSKSLTENQIEICSGSDTIVPIEERRHFGLYRRSEESPLNLAMPVWNFGKFYESILKNILDGSFKYDSTGSEVKALNYYWGMSTGLIDIIYSQHLPIGTARLITLLKEVIQRGDFNPFTGILYSQDGVVQSDPDRIMPMEEIIEMTWLAENVVGFIPKVDQLEDMAKPVVEKVGVETQPETGVVL